MEPMKAPWADPALTGHPASDPASSSGLPASSRRGVHTGNPVKPLIDAEPALPSVNPQSWPSEWEPAAKRVRSQHDVQSALQGSTLRNFVAFTLSLSEAVTGVTQSQECNVSPAAQAVIAALDRLLALCEETPATTHEVRYGNPAYREWFDKMQAVAPELIYDILGDEIGSATVELVPYVLDSFGNRRQDRLRHWARDYVSDVSVLPVQAWGLAKRGPASCGGARIQAISGRHADAADYILVRNTCALLDA